MVAVSDCAIGMSGMFAFTALLQAGVDLKFTPWQVYEFSSGLTEEAIALRLVGLLEAVIVKTNRRLMIKAWALAGSLLMILMTLIVTLIGLGVG